MDPIARAGTLLAILISLASAAYARRLTNIERDRRHDEKRPRVTARFDDSDQPEAVFVKVSDGLERYDSVELELVLEAQGRPDPLVAIVHPETGERMRRVELGPVEVPRELRVFVCRQESAEEGEALLRVIFRKGRKRWTVPHEVEVPPKWDPSMRVLSF